jgi:hypothetical protein
MVEVPDSEGVGVFAAIALLQEVGTTVGNLIASALVLMAAATTP